MISSVAGAGFFTKHMFSGPGCFDHELFSQSGWQRNVDGVDVVRADQVKVVVQGSGWLGERTQTLALINELAGPARIATGNRSNYPVA